MIPLLLACGGEPPADTGLVYSDDPETTLGGARPARVTLPASYTAERDWPLVVLLHGYAANSTLQDIIFGLGLRIDELGFILVQPEGTVDSEGAQFWNATEECCNFDGSTVDDVGYLSGLIDEAHAQYPLSTVVLVGHSNGGFMAYRMACDVPQQLDGVVVLAGATYKDELDCLGTQPVSVLHIHGTEDESIAFASSETHAGAEESAGRWATKAECTSPAAVLGTRDYLSSVDGEETTPSQWAGCADTIDVQWWNVSGGDHILLGNAAAFKDDVAAWAVGRE